MEIAGEGKDDVISSANSSNCKRWPLKCDRISINTDT